MSSQSYRLWVNIEENMEIKINFCIFKFLGFAPPSLSLTRRHWILVYRYLILKRNCASSVRATFRPLYSPPGTRELNFSTRKKVMLEMFSLLAYPDSPSDNRRFDQQGGIECGWAIRGLVIPCFNFLITPMGSESIRSTRVHFLKVFDDSEYETLTNMMTLCLQSPFILMNQTEYPWGRRMLDCATGPTVTDETDRAPGNEQVRLRAKSKALMR